MAIRVSQRKRKTSLPRQTDLVHAKQRLRGRAAAELRQVSPQTHAQAAPQQLAQLVAVAANLVTLRKCHFYF
jgi:hypothetical protein